MNDELEINQNCEKSQKKNQKTSQKTILINDDLRFQSLTIIIIYVWKNRKSGLKQRPNINLNFHSIIHYVLATTTKNQKKNLKQWRKMLKLKFIHFLTFFFFQKNRAIQKWGEKLINDDHHHHDNYLGWNLAIDRWRWWWLYQI